MQAKDVMTEAVVVVQPETRVEDVARLLLERRISAVPVVSATGALVGIVSEGDLLRRAENDTEYTSWWLTRRHLQVIEEGKGSFAQEIVWAQGGQLFKIPANQKYWTRAPISSPSTFKIFGRLRTT